MLRGYGSLEVNFIVKHNGGPSKCLTKLMVIGLWSMGRVPKIFRLCLGLSSLFFSYEVPSPFSSFVSLWVASGSK
jgi:hypothetical protein